MLLCSGQVLAQQAAPAALPASLQDLDGYVEAVRKQFDVPGIAVAIVKDGQVVLERGYGVRELGKPAKVDQDTLFAIASNTKAFTAASLNMLAEDGKLDMDDRVIDHLPWFQMSDAYVTREMRIRDLLAHRSGLGLGAGDLLFWPTTDYSSEEVARRLRDVPLSGSFRARYAYDNILFGVAQQVIEQVSGMSYQQFLQTRILQPLGMRDTRYNSDHLKPGDNVASGHAKANFEDLQPAPRMTWSNVAGAGGIYSSVHDMSQWMRMQLAGGIYTDAQGRQQQLFSADSQQQMWSLLTPIPVSEPKVEALKAAKPNFQGYGEGWFLSDYRGQKLVWHTGGWPGMVSRVTLVPGQNLGVVVLTSQEVGAAFNAITMQVLDAYLQAPHTDWLAAYAQAVAQSKDKADQKWQELQAQRDASSGPSLPLADYATTLRDPWYGDVVIAQEGGKLVLRFSHTRQLVGDLEHWQQDTFIVRWRERWLNADAFLTFALEPDGSIREARMEAISPLTDFSFDFQDLRLVPVAAGPEQPAG
ncbi:beta-lactamase [Pseudoxanthomonas dokdonensis]|uniref:Beta-lactamase n=1 Tax=Pseudoxanthomonas dokdonensis TaxID=344882 RepID=A0A0R0CHA9_9GAMM|nr:beta-lactamase [Pseudoxanthomonas dokdonensis]